MPIENVTVGFACSVSEAVNDNVIVSSIMAFVGSVLFDTTVILFIVGAVESLIEILYVWLLTLFSANTSNFISKVFEVLSKYIVFSELLLLFSGSEKKFSELLVCSVPIPLELVTSKITCCPPIRITSIITDAGIPDGSEIVLLKLSIGSPESSVFFLYIKLDKVVEDERSIEHSTS